MKKGNISKILTSLFLTVIISVSVICPSFAEEEKNIESLYMNSIIRMILGEYRFDVSEADIYRDILDYVLKEKPELLEGIIKASTQSLDEHSVYYSQEDLKAFYQVIQQEYVGIGITVERVTGGILIKEVAMGGPADKAGIKAGDIIWEIDGKDAQNFSINEATQKIRGEENTPVSIMVKRDKNFFTFKMLRAAVNASSCTLKELDGGVGYLQITRFTSQTPDEIKQILLKLDEKGIKKLIIDVRDNPGGELKSVINSLSLFVPKGKLLLTVDYKAEGYDLTIKSSADFLKTDRKIVVLVNENSASAAEVFAGGIMHNNIGETVGEITYGKGSVQEFVGLYSLPGYTLGDIKLSVAEYMLPNGESIHKKGLRPTYRIKNIYEEVDTKGIMPLLFDKKYTVGDSGYGVIAIKQRLGLLGYHIDGAEDVFDEETAVAVKEFQAQAGLHPYGVADFTTQKKLGEVVEEAEVLVDRQFDKAYELLTGKQFSEYKEGENK